MDRRQFISSAAIGAIGCRIEASQAANEQPPDERPVLLIGIGTGGCGPLRDYERRLAADAGSDLLVYASREDLRPRPVNFMGLDYAADAEAGLDAFESLWRLLHARLKQMIEQCAAVIAVSGLGGGINSFVSSTVSAIARKERKRSVAIVSRPFSFEGSLRAGTAHVALSRLRCEYDVVCEMEADAVLQDIHRPLTSQKALARLDIALAKRIALARRALSPPSPS